MESIVPIVGISRIANLYDAFVLGMDGVLSKGSGFSPEALKTIQNLHSVGKEVVIFSNSPLRVRMMAKMLSDCLFDLKNIRAIVTAGEILHYQLPLKTDIGHRYYNLGSQISEGVFEEIDYQKTADLLNADFAFIGDVPSNKTKLEDYQADLEAMLAMHLPLICVGTDLAMHQNGEIVLGAGAVAERYAMLGGKIITVGKPDQHFALYAKEAFSSDKMKILYVGDSMLSDMKSADFMKADKVLVAKGIHIHALGEGYIPDIQKARTLGAHYGVYPNYLISDFRW